jgi:hypothetical protein
MSVRNWKPIGTTIGGLLLGSILRGGFDPLKTFLLGAALAIGFFVLGIVIIARDKG